MVADAGTLGTGERFWIVPSQSVDSIWPLALIGANPAPDASIPSWHADLATPSCSLPQDVDCKHYILFSALHIDFAAN